MRAFGLETTGLSARYNLNKFSLKRFFVFADDSQLIEKKNTRILHPI